MEDPVLIRTPRWGPLRIERSGGQWVVSRSDVWRKRTGSWASMRGVARSSLWAALRESFRRSPASP